MGRTLDPRPGPSSQLAMPCLSSNFSSHLSISILITSCLGELPPRQFVPFPYRTSNKHHVDAALLTKIWKGRSKKVSVPEKGFLTRLKYFCALGKRRFKSEPKIGDVFYPSPRLSSSIHLLKRSEDDTSTVQIQNGSKEKLAKGNSTKVYWWTEWFIWFSEALPQCPSTYFEASQNKAFQLNAPSSTHP